MKIGKRSSVVLAVFGLVTAIAGHGHEAPPANGRDVAGKAAWVTGERIVANEPQNWLSHGRGYDEKRHSPLKQISVGNVSKLKLAWFQDLDTNRGQEATPIVVDGLMFTTSAWSHVQAFDAVSGRPLWTFDPKVPGATGIKACCDVVNRGVAVWEGKVYVGALDGRLIALDAKTGKELWSTLTVDPTKPYTITGAPRVVKGKVLIGNGGAESGVRGYLSAYDADNGTLVWRFYTTPNAEGKPDGAASDKVMADFAAATWFDGEWKRSGGGGTIWDSMAYDPQLDLLYVGVDNGSPWNYMMRSGGKGDNLFTSSILALRPDTGEYVWHYQTTPGDEWDYAATQSIILADIEIAGQKRQVLMQAPKNGFFYVLDRKTGKLVSGEPFVTTSWAKSIDIDTGRPNIVPEARYTVTGKPYLGLPSPFGGHSWYSMAFDPDLNLVFIPAQDIAFPYAAEPTFEHKSLAMNLGTDLGGGASMPTDPKSRAAAMKSLKGFILAWDPAKQKEVWRVPHTGPGNGGILSTAGDLIFQGTALGEFVAYRASTGERLWSFPAQSGIVAAPVSYAVKGRQYVSIVVGWGGGYALVGGPGVNRSRVLTFALNGNARLPAIKTVNATQPKPPEFPLPVAATISLGKSLYSHYCFACHGSDAVSGGVLPDLRRSAMVFNQSLFNSVVREGALTPRGMVSFAADLSPEQTEAIRAYVIQRARESYVEPTGK
jgi:quinohemoprotein ethanol dehydrogenase